ncbi:hypothetical protein B0J11DRAFT_35607 [Dendryphion nanum]|uniref:Glycine zipper 2TM domain-containing protein n=1 Tax=Dendryphion nanum TaxID=256645 RepID=A0A9P9IZ19_9PLEO|nr:hypothetical protein B0J11DRAFT_35607 [Dendryphion nanum]
MSDPYNNQYQQGYQQGYGGGYPPNQYGTPAPGQYGQAPYPPQGQNQSWEQQQQYQQQQQGYGGSYDQNSQSHSQGNNSYGSNGNNYGPPAQGGFQHSQEQPRYDGSYNNNTSYGHPPPAQQFPGQQQYNQHDQTQAPYQGQPGQNYGPTDPNSQAEGDRGLMGALGGGAAGYFAGNKLGGHNIIGGLLGAFAGSKLEDKHKNKKYGH